MNRNWRFEYGKYFRDTDKHEPIDVVYIFDRSDFRAKQEATRIAKSDLALGDMLTYYMKKYAANETCKWKKHGDGFRRDVWFPKGDGEFYKGVIGGFVYYMKLEPWRHE